MYQTADKDWPSEFARIIRCEACTNAMDPNLLRDNLENVPQPGYIGQRYRESGVLLVGQNPGTPKSLAPIDPPYTRALRALRDESTPERYVELLQVMRGVIPQWPIHGSYFPLAECDLALDDIAYLNVVRCRTTKDRAPGRTLVRQCTAIHFDRWFKLLAPRVVVFIGKWAYERASGHAKGAGVPCAFINRERSLSSQERRANRAEVIALVRKYRGTSVPSKPSDEDA